MNISARNTLRGKVVGVKPGVVNSEVVIQLTGGEQIVSMISKDSAERLGLHPGKEVYAVIKASSVMIATD
jgi:molybdopterin-binding protein